MSTRINGVQTSAEKFAFDGCHKIYILEDTCDLEEAVKMGCKILPIKSIRSTYMKSCSYKFISNWKLTKHIVEQGSRWYPYKKLKNAFDK